MRAIGYDGLVKCLVRLDVKAKQESALQVQAAAEQLQEEVARLKAEAAEAGNGVGMCRHGCCSWPMRGVRNGNMQGVGTESTSSRCGGTSLTCY